MILQYRYIYIFACVVLDSYRRYRVFPIWFRDPKCFSRDPRDPRRFAIELSLSLSIDRSIDRPRVLSAHVPFPHHSNSDSQIDTGSQVALMDGNSREAARGSQRGRFRDSPKGVFDRVVVGGGVYEALECTISRVFWKAGRRPRSSTLELSIVSQILETGNSRPSILRGEKPFASRGRPTPIPGNAACSCSERAASHESQRDHLLTPLTHALSLSPTLSAAAAAAARERERERERERGNGAAFSLEEKCSFSLYDAQLQASTLPRVFAALDNFLRKKHSASNGESGQGAERGFGPSLSLSLSLKRERERERERKISRASFGSGALSSFGSAFLNKFSISELDCDLTSKVTMIDTPGILAGSKQTLGRTYDYGKTVRWRQAIAHAIHAPARARLASRGRKTTPDSPPFKKGRARAHAHAACSHTEGAFF